ncbi:MAG TPA: amino acid ABC transporter substrate-binding protein [Streptosporangiaceae bacterium]|nr:amino acid ABC transporter substrate-binding protein [Streptosporangiaceae bacterium]
MSLTAGACALAVSLAACASSGGGTTGSSSAPIKIGGTLGLTGALSESAQEYQAVYNYWAKQVNASGGLLGRKVVMDIKNDNSTPSTAQSEYQTLLTSDNVDLVLAPYATFIGAPIVPMVKAAGKLLFNGGFVGKQYFAQDGGWMVGTYTYQEPDYTRGLFEAVKSLPNGQRPTRVGILTNDNPFTLVARDGYQGQGGAINYAKQDGMTVVYSQTYSATTTDFTSAIERAKQAGVDMLVILGLPNDEDTIVKQAHVLGFTPKVMCVCGSQASTLPNWPQLGAATNGVVGTTVAWPSQNFPGEQAVVNFAKSRGEAVVPTYDFVAYAALQVIQQAVEGAKTLDQQKLKAYIYSHTFHTAVGTIKYDADGTPPFSEVITQTVNGQQQPVSPPSVATAKLKTQ